MNFGVRLPGPFRIGVSSKGRVNLGMTAGPFSASVGLSPSPQSTPGALQLAGVLDQYVQQALSEGWKVTGRNQSAVILRHGSVTMQLTQVTPDKVEASRITSRSSILIWALVAVVVFALCMWASA